MAFFNRTLTFLDLYFLQYNYDVTTLFGNSRAADDAGTAAKGANIALNLASSTPLGVNTFNTGIAVGSTTPESLASGQIFPGGLLTASIAGGNLPTSTFYGQIRTNAVKEQPNIRLDNQYKSTFRFSGAPLTAGVRDVSGTTNNQLDPNLGSTLTVLPRMLQDPLKPIPYVTGSGGFTSGSYTNPTTDRKSKGVTGWNGNYTYDYGVRGGTIYDASTRLISNYVADSNNTITKDIYRYLADPINSTNTGAVKLVNGTYVTNNPALALKRGLKVNGVGTVAVDNPEFEKLVIDNPHNLEWTNTGTQFGTRLNPVTGAVNPLRNNEWFASFGQFFDHGLDFERKGQDGKVVASLMPSDPIYQKAYAFYNTNIAPGFPPNYFATPADQDLAARKYASNALSQVRSDTVWVNIGQGSTDSLLTALGFTESSTFKPGGVASTSTLLQSAGADVKTIKIGVTGNFVLNGQIIAISGDQTFEQVAYQLNSLTPLTGVTAVFGGSFFALNPIPGAAINHDSTMIDLSQIFGNVFSQTVFLKEYDNNGKTTGKLLVHTPTPPASSESTLATWSDIKTNALKLGLTLHDYNVTDVPLVEEVAGQLKFVALNKVTGAKEYLIDTADTRLKTGGTSVLALAGVAFLDDLSPFVDDGSGIAGHGLSGLSADTPDITLGDWISPGQPGTPKTTKYWLDHHFVSGDGRANENIGLSAIHEIFVKFMNGNVDSVTASYKQQLINDPTRAGQLVAPTGEQLFQEAKILSEVTYQHYVFATYIRRVSPNVAGFVASDVTVDAGITQEFAQCVFRLHTQVGDALNSRTNTGGIVDYTANGDVSLKLLDAFLNPLIYNNKTAAELSAGSLSSASYNTDEFIENTLRNDLLGAGLDLAAFNLLRARDNGLPNLNEARRRFTDQLSKGLAPGLGGGTNPGAAAILALLPTLRPYTSWQDFKDHLLNAGSAKQFIKAYARDTILTTFGKNYSLLPKTFDGTSLQAWGDLQASTLKADYDLYAAALEYAASQAEGNIGFMGQSNFNNPNANGNQEFEKIDLWMGGLAEAKAVGGMMGTTFDAIFATQMQKEQEGDRFYYLPRAAAEDWFIDQVDSKSFVDIIMDSTGLKHLYADPFSVNDSNIELGALPPTNDATRIQLPPNTRINGVITATLPANTNPNQIPAASRFAPLAPPPVQTVGNPPRLNTNDFSNYFNTHPLIDPNNIAAVKAFLGNSAGWVRTGGTSAANAVYTFCGNPGDYTDTEGVLNPNGAGHSSEMIAGTSPTVVTNGTPISGIDRINGGDGNDTIYGDGGNDILEGGQGNDYLYGGDGDDTITDGTINGGDDVIVGGLGNDTITSGDGIDTVFGDDGNDTIRGGNGADALHGGAGNDLIYGDSGVITGAGATAVMDALGGADAITGGEGNDTLYGGGGLDTLDGGIGSDLLVGGADADAIACGLDNDVDTVRFDTAPVNGIIDTIAQFTVGVATGSPTGTLPIVPGYTANDLVSISRAVFPGGNAALATGVLATTAFQYTDAVANPVASTTAVRFLYNQTNGALWYDQDGSGNIAAQQIATFAAYDPLNPNDPTALAPVLQNTNIVII